MGRSTRIIGMLLLAVAAGTPAGAATLRGSVVAADGTPASGAKVWGNQNGISPLERREVAADPAGRFVLELGQGQWQWQIEANLGDQGTSSPLYINPNNLMGSDPPSVTIQLKRQGRLHARLIEAETGRPIVGGRLVLDNGLDPVADRDGRLEVAGLSRARFREAVVAAPGRQRLHVMFEMADRPVTELEVAVPRGGTAAGRVLDVTGRPIAGAMVVQANGSSSPLMRTGVRADAQGRFEFPGLAIDRTASLVASASGCIADTQNGIRANPDGTSTPVEFQLGRNPQQARVVVNAGQNQAAAEEPRRDVAGLVRDLDGKPVAATVRWGLFSGPGAIETRSDAQGKFRLARVVDQPNLVCVIPDGSTNLAPEVEAVEGEGDQKALITLARGRTLSGVVRDDRGTPFAGVTVTPTIVISNYGSTELTDRVAMTDAQGRFTIRGLPDFAATYNFVGEGLVPLNGQSLQFDDANAVTMTASGAIAGKVVDPAGRPVRNFRVLINTSREQNPGENHGNFFQGFSATGLTFTSEDGSFLIRNLPPGSFQRVTVLVAGHGEASVDRVVAIPRNQITAADVPTFAVGPTHSLRVHAFDEGSKIPVPDARVGLLFGPEIGEQFQWGTQDVTWGNTAHARTDPAGMATFDSIAFAEGTILIQVPGYARQHLDWHDGSRAVDVPLTREAVVAGEILDDATGRAYDGVFVYLTSPQNGQLDITPKFGDGGRFRFGELPAGTYALSVQTPTRGEIHQDTIMVQAGEHLARTIRIPPKPAELANPVLGTPLIPFPPPPAPPPVFAPAPPG